MNICIDQGNTRVKVGVFNGHQLLRTEVTTQLDANYMTSLIGDSDGIRCIYASVARQDNSVADFLTARFGDDFIRFDHTTPVPITNNYATPETLGLDRLAAAVGAYSIMPAHNLLIIDAGTAVTYDMVEAPGIYVGGNIAPGVQMRLRALHDYTGRLPLVDVAAGTIPFIGNDTQSAIRSGVLNGIGMEMEGYVSRLGNKYGKLCVFLTGGDAPLFHNRLNFANFAEPNLVLIGLNSILDFNATTT
ncbi:MAG: type III pantothenate kinase [Paludibacteraceae bacterium]|nr:type III pantothenate kinase [Paludibacteraceae bacterium]